MSLVVRRGLFTYDGDSFNAQLEDGSDTHSRMESDALLTLITSRRPGARDKPVSFYRVQLKHYGLKDLKTRDPAKKALQRAIEAAPKHQLSIPQSLLDMEQELKVEWVASHAAVEKKERADYLRRLEEAKAAAAKRAAQESTMYDAVMSIDVLKGKKGPKINLQTLPRHFQIITKAKSGDDYGHSFLDIALSDRGSHLWGYFQFRNFSGVLRSNALQSTNVSQGETLSTLWRSSDDGDSRERLSPDNVFNITFLEQGKLKGEIHRAEGANSIMMFIGVEGDLAFHTPSLSQWKDDWKVIAQIARQEAGIKKRPREVTSDTDSDYFSEDPGEVAEREQKMQKRQAAADIVAQKIFAQYEGKQSGKSTKKAKNGKTTATKLVPSDLEAQYKIVSPELEEQYGHEGGPEWSLHLVLSPRRSHLWGKFDIGILTGYLRSSQFTSESPVPVSAGAVVSCIWRGEETGEGEMTIDNKRNKLTITFLGGGKLRADMLTTYGDFSLIGTRIADMAAKGKQPAVDVRKWKKKWKGYNPAAYERARVARWGGGWGHDNSDDESVKNSDTESEEGSRSGGSNIDSDAERSERGGYDGEFEGAYAL